MKSITQIKIIGTALLLVQILFLPNSTAQTQLKDIARIDVGSGWVYFNPGIRMTPEVFFSTFRTELGMSIADDFKLVRTRTDGIGITHYYFEQYHEGIKVEGGVMLLHEQNGELSVANGKVVEGITISARPAVTADLARQKSIEAVGAKTYAWEDANLEAKLQANTKSASATHFPKPELLYVRLDPNGPFSAENVTLAYNTTINSTEPFDVSDVYVDAYSGKVLYQQSRSRHCHVQGKGETNYYSDQTFCVEQYSTSPLTYYLANSDYNFETKSHLLSYITSTTILPGSLIDFGVGSNNQATKNQNSAHWCAQKFFENADVNLFGNLGYPHDILVGGTGNNASFTIGNPISIVIPDGDGLNFSSLATLDIVGHELTHSLLWLYNGGFLPTGESASLEEAYCDIFGTMTEYYALNNNGDYFIGEDCTLLSPGMIRNMEDPGMPGLGHPNTYLSTNTSRPWAFNSDPEYIYKNCGVMNYWFYLLSQQVAPFISGTNDNGEFYKVSSIGRANAAKIVFHSLSYISPIGNYKDACLATIQAAKDLYGVNSPAVLAVVDAWYAVGVCGKADLVIQDDLFDSGLEPNPTTLPLWVSEDIWVRTKNDIVLQLTPTLFTYQNEHIDEDLTATGGQNPSYVYVKIRNNSNEPSSSALLKMYWSRASTGLIWPTHWINYYCPADPTCTLPGNACPCGDEFEYPNPLVPGYYIPSIPAHSFYVVEIQWFPPDPLYLPDIAPLSEDEHFCLLGRIESLNDPMHNEQINVPIYQNVAENNNIAWQNIRIQSSQGVYLSPMDLHWMYVRTRPVYNNGEPVRFRFHDNPENPFLGKGDIMVRLTDTLFSQWVLSGMESVGLEQIGGTPVFKLIAPEAFLYGVNMPFGRDNSIGLAFNPFDGQPIDLPGKFMANIAQMEVNSNTGNYEVVGGESFELRVNPYPIWAGPDLYVCKGDPITLTANLDNWDQNDSTFVSWDNGLTGASIVVSPDMTQTYIVVVTNSDGNAATDEVTVFVEMPTAWYGDADGDGFGSDSTLLLACRQPPGYVDNALDCNDFANGIYPEAIENCNNLDDNCNGLIDDDCVVSNTSIFSKISIRLFPNPTTGSLTLELTGVQPKTGSVQILDLYGRLVGKEHLPSGQLTHPLSVATLPAGMYFVQVTEGGVPIWAERIVKQ